MRLIEKKALITGGASGLGEGIVRGFVAEGAQVIICDIDQTKGQALAKELGEAACFHLLDVTNEQHWDRVMTQVGPLDVLVNNAGVSMPCTIEQVDLEAFRKEMDIDVFGTLLGCKYAVANMQAQGTGSIINVSSSCGVKAEMEMVIYSAAKAGVLNITKSVAKHTAAKGYAIRCNSILPGLILSPMLEMHLQKAPDPDAALQRWSQKQPIGRLGKIEEIAAMAIYLASDESGYTTGADFCVDGGTVI